MEKFTLVKNWKSGAFFLLLLLGVVISVYLVQEQQIFKSKAAIDVSAALEIKDHQGNSINCSGTTCYTNSDSVTIRIKDIKVLQGE